MPSRKYPGANASKTQLGLLLSLLTPSNNEPKNGLDHQDASETKSQFDFADKEIVKLLASEDFQKELRRTVLRISKAQPLNVVPNVVHPASLLRLPHIVGDRKASPPLQGLLPISAAAFWQGIENGIYPKGIKLSPRVTVWRASEILALTEGGAK